MNPGDLVRIVCDGDQFSDNYIRYLLNTIGDDPKPYGLIIGTFARADEDDPHAVTFYRVWVGGREHLIEEDALEIVCKNHGVRPDTF